MDDVLHEVPRERAGAADAMRAAAALGMLLAEAGQAMDPDGLLARAPWLAGRADAAGLAAAAATLGCKTRIHRATRRALARLAAPGLLLGRAAGELWLVRPGGGDHLVLVEPDTGRRTTHTPDELAAFALQLLQLHPQHASGESAAPRRGRGLAKLLEEGKIRRALAEIALASVAINVVALATPIFMMTVYNKVIGHQALRTLDALAIGMVTLIGFELALRAIRGQLAAHAGARLDLLINGAAIRHLLALPYRTLESAAAGGVNERLRQLDQLRGFLTGQLPLLLVDLAFVGLFVAALFLVAPLLGWITLLALPILALVSALGYRRQAAIGREAAAAQAGRTRLLDETFGQALTVKALGLETAMARRLEPRLLASAWSGYRGGRLGAVIGSAGHALQHATALVLIYVGARQIVAGELSVGALVAASILSARALQPARQLFWAWTQLAQAREVVGRLDATLRLPIERTGGGGPPPALVGALTLEGITCRYAKDRPPALRDLDLTIAPGTMLAVAGAPGSGKSTLIKLLIGLATPERGRVLIDGHELGDVAPARWRSQIGVVPQEAQLFAGTIAENIAIGLDGIERPRIAAAARFVGLDPHVRRLPDGYDTILGERGLGLSLGQRQLVALARAVIRNPRLLLLDEATSGLDPAAEQLLLANLRRAGRGRTIILVTHRPAVLEACDRAVLLDQGRIMLDGSPSEIVARMRGRAGASGLQAVS